MEKTLTDIILTHSLLANIVNLEETITKKDEEINVLEEEISNLKARVESLLEQNKSLEQERFNLSVQIEKLVAQFYPFDVVITTNPADTEKSYSFAKGVSFDATNVTQLAIFNVCEKLCVRLIEKNKVGEKSTVTPLQLLQAFIHIIK
jgi:regulator of replication initiation timing